MITAATSGGLGDIVYSIPVLKALGVTDIYVKTAYYFPPYGNMYTAMRTLLEAQGFTVHSTDGSYGTYNFEPGILVDYNLDNARMENSRNVNHIIVSFMNHFRCYVPGWQQPWLKVPDRTLDVEEPFYLVHLTQRWRKRSKVDWKAVYRKLPRPVYFLGFADEHAHFEEMYGPIPHLPTEDVLHAAQYVKRCSGLYCNQSVILTLAQGLGRPYWLEQNRGKFNALLKTPNEHIL